MITLGHITRRLKVHHYVIDYMVKTGKVDTPAIVSGRRLFTRRIVGQIVDILREKGNPLPGADAFLRELED